MFLRGQIRNRLLDAREKWKQALDPYCSWEIGSPWVRHASFTPWILRKQFSDSRVWVAIQRGSPGSVASCVYNCSRDDKHELLQMSAPSNKQLCNCPGKLGTTKVGGDSLTCYSELLPLILIAWWKLDLHSAFILALSKTDIIFSSKIIKGQKSIFWCENLLPLTWNPAYVLFTD